MIRHLALCLSLFCAAAGAVGQSREASIPGNIKLLPGYTHTSVRPIDSAYAGRIWKPHGLVIGYDIGMAAGHYETSLGWTSRAEWKLDQVMNGKRVVCIFTKSHELLIAFPDDLANFTAKIRTKRDLAEMMLMVLTYGGS